jgi:hypothetical protein
VKRTIGCNMVKTLVEMLNMCMRQVRVLLADSSWLKRIFGRGSVASMKAQAGDFLLQAWRGKRAVLFRRGSGKTSLQPDYRGLGSMIADDLR